MYDTKIEDAHPSDLLRQSIHNTEKLLYLFSDSICQYCQDTSINTGAYIVFYQGGSIDRFTHILGQFSESSAENEYNSAFTAYMYLAHFRILNNEFLNKDTYDFA